MSVQKMTRTHVEMLNSLAHAVERAARAREKARAARIYLERENPGIMNSTTVDDMNEALVGQINALTNILSDAISSNPTIDIAALKRSVPTEAIFANRPDLTLGLPPTRNSAYVPPLEFFASLIPGARAKHAGLLAAANAEADEIYEIQKKNYQLLKQRRADALSAAIAETEAFNRQLDEFSDALRNSDTEAITHYFGAVFECSQYPSGFPKKYKIAYVPESRQLVVDYQMPTIDGIVTRVEKYRYVKASGTVSETKKPERIRQQLYAEAISSTVLRTLHEVFVSDTYNYVDVVAINAFVDTIDRGTGQRIQPYILSARTSRDEFGRLALGNVDPTACLKRLAASISRSPAELVPIKPIVDINMVDRRFVQEQNVLSTLDNRTNLMTLSPGEFESLITNLFQKMGLETKLTQPSRDGGVDCVAFDQRPILGGKVVVQAKRYKNTVGVGSVRDLFGTMINEGASKGILVSTSGYGKASFEFANGKPIELISGSNLLYLLREHAGVDAKIEPPDDWVDFQETSQ
jgi:restriction system protein